MRSLQRRSPRSSRRVVRSQRCASPLASHPKAVLIASSRVDFASSASTCLGWARGHTASTHSSVLKVVRANRIPDDKVFISNGAAISGSSIVKRLLELGVEYHCVICGIAEWCGRPLVLHLDHINGIHNDHRRANLWLLCPNCHSQTDTYCNKAREPSARYLCSPTRWAIADDLESRIFA